MPRTQAQQTTHAQAANNVLKLMLIDAAEQICGQHI